MATPDRPPIKDRPDRLDLPPREEQAPPPGAQPPRARGTAEVLLSGLEAAWRCRRLLLFVLAANLLLAALVLYPMLGPMDQTLSRSPDAAQIGRQLDPGWWFDLKHSRAFLVLRTVDTIGMASFIMVFIGTFFAGGLLEALRHGRNRPIAFEPMPDPAYGGSIPKWRSASPGPETIQVFLKESARRFPRFLVLLLISLPLYALAQMAFNEWGAAAGRWLLERVQDERIALVVDFVRSALFVTAFHAVTVIFEYARAGEVLRPGTTLLPLLGLPFRLLRRRPAAFLAIELGAVTLQAAAMLAFIPVDRLLGRWPIVAATAGFAAMQIFMFVRLLIRSGAQASQLRLAEDLMDAGS
ncbi:MAG TPA: hypothetical protein VNI57_11415 [Candidatus Saccharimonadales bacterium]|nr:hypothetical protein [Candidatus Saccharimonadales bacterium]